MIGAVLAGRFEVNSLVSEGPILSLLRANDRITGRDASLRVVRAPFDGQAAFLDALEAAVRKVAPIAHPNVERLIELDRHDGQAYIVGEWTQAPSLADRIRKLAPFSVPVAVAAALSVARGLEAFHKVDIVHGDVSPENACLMADGEVRLQMGGLWEAYGASPTAGSMVLPTLAPALAPEVGKGAFPSLRSDVYSVGVLLFELLTGRKPYVGDTPLATAMRHSTEPTPRVRGYNQSVPIVLDEIIAKAMDKDPEVRYANAGELSADLRLVQDALRFGRTLSWPLRPTAATLPPVKGGKAAKVANKPTPTPGRVAPKMSAIREDVDEDYGKPERDVPAWASVGLALVACVAVSLLAVYFVLNLNRPRLVTVPSVYNLTLPEARESFEKLHLTLTRGESIPNDKVPADRILKTEPSDGTRIREESTVVATISAGPAQVAVPDLRGMTPDLARAQLEKLNLRLDDEVERVFRTGSKDGNIIEQSPKANVKLARDGLVKVTIHDASLPEPELKRYEYTINIELIDLKERSRVKVDVEDVDGTRTVQNRRRSPGDTIRLTARARGERATFRIYYDDELKKTIIKYSDGREEVTP